MTISVSHLLHQISALTPLVSRQSFSEPSNQRGPYPLQLDSEASSASSSTSSRASSPAYTAPSRPKVGRPPKDRDGRDKKRPKKAAAASSNPRAGNAGGEGEGMHVCVTCGRTDSPEWRKGPLGPKTLCNVSLLGFGFYNTWSSAKCRLAVCGGRSAIRQHRLARTRGQA